MRIPNLQTLKTAAQQLSTAAKNTEETTKKVTEVANAIKEGQEGVTSALENGPKLTDIVNKKDEVTNIIPEKVEVTTEAPKPEVTGEVKSKEMNPEAPKTEVEPKTEAPKAEAPAKQDALPDVKKLKIEELKSVYPDLKLSADARVAVKKHLREAELKFMRQLKEKGGHQLKKGGTVATFEGIISSQKLKVDLEKGKRLDTLRGMVGKEGVDFRDDYSKMFRADHITFKGTKGKMKGKVLQEKSQRVQKECLNTWYFAPARREAANALKAVKDKSEQGFVSGVSKKFFA